MDKIWKTIRSVSGHDLISGSTYVFIGGLVSSFFAFILNIYFARSLTYQDYGTFTALLSLIALLTIPASSLSPIIARYASMFFARNENKRAGAFYIKSFKVLLIFSFILGVISLALFPVISKFLNINGIGLIFLVAITVGAFYIATLNMAFIQSLLKFKLIGLIHSIAGLGKFFIGITLVLLGFNVYGAIIATLTISLVDFFISIIPLRGIIKNAGEKVEIGVREFSLYAVPASIAILSLSSFILTDVLLVKHFFNPTEAGFYGGLSMVGKVIFYFTAPIAVVMFPLIVNKHAKKESFNKLFYLSIVLVLIPSVSITIFYYLFPNFTINLFLGRKGYQLIAPYLGLFGVFLTIFSVNNIFVSFFLSVKKTLISTVVLFWAIIQIIFICIYHQNFYQIIYVSIITSVLLLGCLVLYYLRIYGINYSRK